MTFDNPHMQSKNDLAIQPHGWVGLVISIAIPKTSLYCMNDWIMTTYEVVIMDNRMGKLKTLKVI